MSTVNVAIPTFFAYILSSNVSFRDCSGQQVPQSGVISGYKSSFCYWYFRRGVALPSMCLFSISYGRAGSTPPINLLVLFITALHLCFLWDTFVPSINRMGKCILQHAPKAGSQCLSWACWCHPLQLISTSFFQWGKKLNYQNCSEVNLPQCIRSRGDAYLQWVAVKHTRVHY